MFGCRIRKLRMDQASLSNSDFPKPNLSPRTPQHSFPNIPHPLESTNTSPTVETLANEETRTDKICSSIDIYIYTLYDSYLYIISIELSPPSTRSKSFGIFTSNGGDYGGSEQHDHRRGEGEESHSSLQHQETPLLLRQSRQGNETLDPFCAICCFIFV